MTKFDFTLDPTIKRMSKNNYSLKCLSSFLVLLLCFVTVSFCCSSSSQIRGSEENLPQNSPKEFCWGYEEGCSSEKSFGRKPKLCPNDKIAASFWEYADFGYVHKVRKNLMGICESENDESFLKCSRNLRYCQGRNIYLDFKRLKKNREVQNRYREDLFQPGDIGGTCTLNSPLLHAQNEHKSPLQSWYAELENFSQLDNMNDCDVTLEGKVVLMKLDYGGNMYHHFCDFFNLYASQHVNGSNFDRNVTVIMWDTVDSYYHDPFRVSWKAFTDKPVISLVEFAGKKVCLKGEVMFPLLARMVFGLYYNSYVPSGCTGSNLFRAFSRHLLNRLDITNHYPPMTSLSSDGRKLRVTFLQRGQPGAAVVYRQIKNKDALVAVLQEFDDLDVQVVEYDWRKMPFEEQLNITYNTDIFIGMHGAGLAHFLFLPEWAVAFELFNCEDVHCYKDLARLRGVQYMTWNSIKQPEAPPPQPSEQGIHPRYGSNPKFWNWSFDPDHFRSLIKLAKEKVLSAMLLEGTVNNQQKDEL